MQRIAACGDGVTDIEEQVLRILVGVTSTRPVLDLMQTLPTFVYLIPAIVFFGIGMVPGLIATAIFVIPAPIRLTHLGITTTPKELKEAGLAFGATPGQLLRKVELPWALPQIMAGLTQTIMLSLSMVVIAALVGADGLGVPVVRALNSVNTALGFEAGLRYWDMDVEVNPALAAGIRRGDSWVDAFGGFRIKSDLGKNWNMTTRGNLGAGGSDLSVGLQLEFARELERGNAIVAGFRLIDLDYEENNVRGIPVVVDLTFLGATFGFMFD